MDLPPEVDELLTGFGAQIRAAMGVVALYVGGSLATGDYRTAVSDIDLIAIIEHPLTRRRQLQLWHIHCRLIACRHGAAKLHCVYVPADELTDVGASHLTWAGQRLFRRPFSGIARAEATRCGFAVFGVPPQAVIPPVTDRELRDAVRHELTGYWSSALRRPSIWLRDFYVDLSLLTLARAEAVLTVGELISKQEALMRLNRFGVPSNLIDEIGKRRKRPRVPNSAVSRLHRALLAHRLVTDGITALLSMQEPDTF
jgi:hypothetical protein